MLRYTYFLFTDGYRLSLYLNTSSYFRRVKPTKNVDFCVKGRTRFSQSDKNGDKLKSLQLRVNIVLRVKARRACENMCVALEFDVAVQAIMFPLLDDHSASILKSRSF